jgi:hypothetical protein
MVVTIFRGSEVSKNFACKYEHYFYISFGWESIGECVVKQFVPNTGHKKLGTCVYQ